MKTCCMILVTALAATLRAAVPVAWTNTPGMPPYPIKPVPHGVPVDFRVTLKGYTEPLIAPGADLHLWYQTNGMGKLWWPAPAALEGDVITASFGPAQDTGADRVSLFFGAPSNVFASAVLRLTHSPGFAPASLPLPVPVLDFSAVELRNLFSLTNGWSFGSAIDLSDSTNYTDAALGAFARTNKVLKAGPYIPTAGGTATNTVTVTTGGPAPMVTGWVRPWSSLEIGAISFGNFFGGWTFDSSGLHRHIRTPFDTTLGGAFTFPEDAYETGGTLALRSDLTLYATHTDVQEVAGVAESAAQEANTALRIVLGESVWFAVTNYMRTAQGVIPSLQLWEVRDSATNLVYDSREEITNTVYALTRELREELEARIPSKAWGNYQSDGTENPQPGEVAIVNQRTVLLTGGGTFNKYVEVGDSSVWVLQSSGPVAFGGDTNGNFFAVLDDEGNAHFRVAKTDSYDLPAFISDILPRQSQNHILIYTATTNRHGNAVSEHPTLSVCSDLKDSLWYEEVEGEIDALGISVSWARDDTIPAWVATVTPDTCPPHLFFRCKVKQEGGVAVINTAPTRFDGGIQIGNGTYRLVPYTSGGKTYLTVEGMP